jgi:hypothetical protein
MGTDSKLLERTEEVVKKVAAENPRDFRANVAVSAQIGSEKDPMKFYIQVYWCFCYNGEQCPLRIGHPPHSPPQGIHNHHHHYHQNGITTTTTTKRELPPPPKWHHRLHHHYHHHHRSPQGLDLRIPVTRANEKVDDSTPKPQAGGDAHVVNRARISHSEMG